MIFTKKSLLACLATLAGQAASACTSIESISCASVSTPPTLDGNDDDWDSIEVFKAQLTGAMNSEIYHQGGQVEVQCVHDSEKVYFLFKIPGKYRFSTDDKHLAAAVSTMFKMGEEATLFNMGGCPLAGDCTEAFGGCDDYKVDIGGHWELRTTEMGVYYGPNDSTGNDEVANKDDEYAVSPICREDDNDTSAANEWEGAWLHTNPIEIEDGADDEGAYVFEMARTLRTNSEETDAQLEIGESVDFGFAFWDPYETEDAGWTDSGHYVTGCSKDWISLQLLDEVPQEEGNLEGGEAGKEDMKGDESSTSAASFAYDHTIRSVSVFVMTCLLKYLFV